MNINNHKAAEFINYLVENRYLIWKDIIVRCIKNKGNKEFRKTITKDLKSGEELKLFLLFHEVEQLEEDEMFDTSLMDAWTINVFLESASIGEFKLQNSDLTVNNMDVSDTEQGNNGNLTQGADYFAHNLSQFISDVIFQRWFTPVVSDVYCAKSLYNAIQHVNTVFSKYGISVLLFNDGEHCSLSIINNIHTKMIGNITMKCGTVYKENTIKRIILASLEEELKVIFYENHMFSNITVEI